jgi:transcriptional regulator with XRE-family HTH domain
MLALYKNIKNRREELGLTKVELANRVGYERSMITKVEQGKVDLTQSKIVAFAEALHTTPAHLMGWEDEEMISTLTKAAEDAVLTAQIAKDEDLKRIIKMFIALPEDKKKTIRQIVEDYYNTFA